MQLIQEKAVNAKVLMVPGRSCSVENKPSPYARAAFSVATDAEMDEALRRLADMLRAETKK
jgi:kynurenine/2-aminoadipate aminotransferase